MHARGGVSGVLAAPCVWAVTAVGWCARVCTSSHAPVFREWILKFAAPARIDLSHPLYVSVSVTGALEAPLPL